MKKTVVAGLALGSGLVLAGCGLGDLAARENQDVVRYDVTDEVMELDVDSGTGDIVVNGSDGKAVRVTETLRWRGDDKPNATHTVDGGLLRLSYDCGIRIGFNRCSVDYRVEVPKDTKVTVETGSGTITLRRLSGALSASAGSGDIEAGDLTGKEGFAETGSGTIRLRYAAVPGKVTAETGSGDATVWLPPGAYVVDTQSGTGDEKVEVGHDPSAANKITVNTGSGDAFVLRAR